MSITVPSSVLRVVCEWAAEPGPAGIQVSWVRQLTSFSPQILLMMELEAGLAEGPSTATTPLDMIWHTERNRGWRTMGWEGDRDRERQNKSIGAKEESKVQDLFKNLRQAI